MRKKRETCITVETERILEIRRRGAMFEAWCSECGKQSRVVRPGEAALLAGVTRRTIYGWVEAGKVHFTETEDGLLFVCLNSL